MYRVNFGMWSGVFAIPNEIIDHHLKFCGHLPLQVLLLLLRNSRPMEATELAEALGKSLNDVQDAITYWVKVGILTEGEQTERLTPPVSVVPTMGTTKQATPVPLTPEPVEQTGESTNKPEQEQTEERRKVRVERFARMTRQDVLEVSERDETVGFLLQESQDVLGRILSNRETESLVGLYYNYDMSPDIVLMLLHYCQSIGKDSIAYIEKMAVDWVNREINTHERAEQELLHLAGADETKDTVAKIFGITTRGVTGKETEYFIIWTKELKMSEQMVSFAHERTMENHGAINFAYTNAILVDWHRKGITSIDQAAREQKPQGEGGSGGRGGKNNTQAEASYSLDDVEDMLDYGSVLD